MDLTKTLGSILTVLALALAGCSEKPESTAPATNQPAPAASTSAAESADFVFTNGKVYPVDKENSWAEAVAVRGDEIVYVGDDAGAKAMVGENTKEIDLDGKLMLPGFVEGHFHSITPGVMLRGVNLQSESMEELLGKLKEYAEANPDLEQIHGWGVRPNLYGGKQPTAATLDKIESERPVFLWQVDGHSAWANSKALEMAGITRDTEDPVPDVAYFVRDDEGNPTGYIVEVPAVLQVLNALQDIDYDYVKEGVAQWYPEYSKAGITAYHDYGLGFLSNDDAVRLMKELEKEGTLTTRFYGSYYWNDANIDPVPIAKKWRDENQTGLVQFNALKINMDGDDDKYSALLVGGYSDKPDADPKPIIPFDVINDVAVRADKEQLHLICHCFGDLAVRKFLDTVELAKEKNPEWDRRPVASHAILVHPDDYPRFKELSATYDTSGQWMALDPYTGNITPERIGPERMNRLFPIKAILEAGGNVSLGSDFPAAAYVSDYRPLNAITQAVTRQMLGKPDMPILGGKDMRLTVAEAIRANTYGSAYGIGVEDKIGSIEVGKKADLIVLDQNLFEIDPHDIYKAKVVFTMMDGVVRYRDGL
ncbi:hypothetical protein SAMN04487965_3268 [Microbulbifer donghaiensis]|uniref:Amidohydrolase 3 domain-containing protein n=1 Tax=Microbulbifer donghaiensis TaxID=494016 RepID=A0A1M5GVR8_9GAMM|nr:amidohydrolase [Microbulbifer donghaiensis]SHG07695.1 hypothetical protein SAMN04487965_3268 [Microbulbifer donghaiensis]